MLCILILYSCFIAANSKPNFIIFYFVLTKFIQLCQIFEFGLRLTFATELLTWQFVQHTFTFEFWLAHSFYFIIFQSPTSSIIFCADSLFSPVPACAIMLLAEALFITTALAFMTSCTSY